MAVRRSTGSAYVVLEDGARRALGSRATPKRVEHAAFLGWSTAHGAVTLWLDGPMRHDFAEGDAQKRFLSLADAAIDGVSVAIAAM